MGCVSSRDSPTVPVTTDEVVGDETKLHEKINEPKTTPKRRKSMSEMSKELLIGVLKRTRRNNTTYQTTRVDGELGTITE